MTYLFSFHVMFSPLCSDHGILFYAVLCTMLGPEIVRDTGETDGNMLRWAKAAIQSSLNWMLLLVLHGISFRGNAHTCRDVVISWNILKSASIELFFRSLFSRHIPAVQPPIGWASSVSSPCPHWLRHRPSPASPLWGQRSGPSLAKDVFECYLLFYLFIGWLSWIRPFLCPYLSIYHSVMDMYFLFFWDTGGIL